MGDLLLKGDVPGFFVESLRVTALTLLQGCVYKNLQERQSSLGGNRVFITSFKHIGEEQGPHLLMKPPCQLSVFLVGGDKGAQ